MNNNSKQLEGCSAEIVDAVTNGILDAALAPDMGYLTEENRAGLLSLFSKLAFSRQAQRELIEWLPEIAFIEKTRVAAILASVPFTEILNHTKLNPPQKIARIHKLAHERRYPLLSKIKKSWEEQARLVNPDPSRVSFHASPFFEKRDLEIRIRVSSAESATALMQKMGSLSAEAWEKLIDPTQNAL
ncbi:MAG: hypothetical protein MUF22_00545 [Chitinispirillaceae bacterium]|jgi:hypothetical protein|nr:hypothetical protein [Chitinispirillaceae bacterium]